MEKVIENVKYVNVCKSVVCDVIHYLYYYIDGIQIIPNLGSIWKYLEGISAILLVSRV